MIGNWIVKFLSVDVDEDGTILGRKFKDPGEDLS
jgi:hypothetical protein